PWVIATMQESFPDTEAEIMIGNTTEVANLVTKRQLDAGLVEGKLMHHQLTMDEFAADYMSVVASPSNSICKNEKSIQFSELQHEVWIAREHGSGTREAMEEMFSEYHFKPGKLIHFGSNQPIKEAVQAGLGISLLSKWA